MTMNVHKPLTVSAQELERMRDQTFIWDVDLPAGLLQDEEMTVLAVQGQVTLQRQLNTVACRGELRVRVQLQSDRDLAFYETELDVHFDEGLEIIDKFNLPDKLELNLEDAIDQIRVDQPIDLHELIRQYVVLNLPMQKKDPETCYNEDFPRYVLADEETVDPTWEAIRKTVENWEQPGQN